MSSGFYFIFHHAGLYLHHLGIAKKGKGQRLSAPVPGTYSARNKVSVRTSPPAAPAGSFLENILSYTVAVGGGITASHNRPVGYSSGWFENMFAAYHNLVIGSTSVFSVMRGEFNSDCGITATFNPVHIEGKEDGTQNKWQTGTIEASCPDTYSVYYEWATFRHS